AAVVARVIAGSVVVVIQQAALDALDADQRVGAHVSRIAGHLAGGKVDRDAHRDGAGAGAVARLVEAQAALDDVVAAEAREELADALVVGAADDVIDTRALDRVDIAEGVDSALAIGHGVRAQVDIDAAG